MFMINSLLIVGILALSLISTAAKLRDASREDHGVSFTARNLQSNDLFANELVGDSPTESVEGALYATSNEEGSGPTEFSESASAFSNVSIEDSEKTHSSEAVGGSASGSTTYGGALYTNSNENKAPNEFSASASSSALATDSASIPNSETETVLSTEATGGSASGSTTYGGALYMNSNEDAPASLSTSAPAEFSASSSMIPPTQVSTTPPFGRLSSRPTNKLTIRPSNRLTAPPTTRPTASPTLRPTAKPTLRPTPIPAKNLSGEALDWIVAHNVRRKFLHEFELKAYVPLQWSEYLAGSAQAYAEKLLSSSPQCAISHGFTGDSYGGENLAANWGYGTYEYTRTRTPTEVLQAWFEDEMNRPFGANGHFTQVSWRSTKYVGCGVASKTFGSGSVCNIQVCRYITPGNCNVNSGNWHDNMLADESFCDPQCPKGGCF